ncbi:MAG: hypothetical protein HC822_13215 [Oscillochloris sp.]|nr:hypothetical protein [Oscillochloris sp.]
MPDFVVSGGTVVEEEAAAAIAAVLVLLEAPAISPAVEPDRWHESARLTIQGMQPARLPASPRWGRIERLRRAGGGGSGIIGL